MLGGAGGSQPRSPAGAGGGRSLRWLGGTPWGESPYRRATAGHGRTQGGLGGLPPKERGVTHDAARMIRRTPAPGTHHRGLWRRRSSFLPGQPPQGIGVGGINGRGITDEVAVRGCRVFWRQEAAPRAQGPRAERLSRPTRVEPANSGIPREAATRSDAAAPAPTGTLRTQEKPAARSASYPSTAES